MENIDKLIENIKEDSLQFPGKYNYKEYFGEVAEIMYYQEIKNINFLLEFWNNKIKKKYFTLQHPIHNDIVTYATTSIRIGTINVIFMIDEDRNYPWIFIQFSHLIDCFICEGEVRSITFLWGGSMQTFVNMLREYLLSNHYLIHTKKKEWGFELFNTRPWHYYYFSLMYLLCIKDYNIKKIRKDNFYFFLENLNLTNSKEMVFITPNIIEPIGDSFIELRQNFSEIIYNQTVSNSIVKNDNNDLTLWISLPGEKREWINQIENTTLIVKELFHYFNKIKIYFDGMTNYENTSNIFTQNEVVYLKFKEAMGYYITKKKCEIVSLIGKTHRQKILYCAKSDICIIDAGTGALVPMFFCKKPCILLYGEPHVKKFFYLNKYNIYADEKYIISMKTSGDPMRRSYYTPWQHIYNITAQMLEQLCKDGKIKCKKLVMHKLEVPPVEILVKQSQLKQKYKITLSLENIILLEILKSHVDNSNMKNSDIIKEFININTKEKQLPLVTDVTAKARIQNHLSYKLGQAMITNSKSLLGYIRMPFVLSYIKDKHKLEKKIYQEKIKKDPLSILPPLEAYPDYQEALKEKECLTYKLGQALIRADKEWYKGGYIKLWFEIRKLKRKFIKK